VEGHVELGGGPEGPAILRDLSMSGFSCVSPIAFDDMTVLEINMRLPWGDAESRPFKAGGAVVRCEPTDGGGHLVAVFFTQMDAANSQLLAEFIELQGS
jgi:hypothetical protein